MADGFFFDSVKEAVKWSEEWATRPDITSQIGKLLMRRGGEISRRDIIDQAQTITAITANCKPFKGMAMKCVYRGHSYTDDKQLAEVMGNNLFTHQNTLKENQRKTPEQLIVLSLVTIKSERAKELYKNRYPASRMAREIGISQQKFCRNYAWVYLRGHALGVLKDWITQAEHEIGYELEQRGWL